MSMTSTERLQAPAGTQPVRVSWIDAAGLAFCHLVTCLAFVPRFFTPKPTRGPIRTAPW